MSADGKELRIKETRLADGVALMTPGKGRSRPATAGAVQQKRGQASSLDHSLGGDHSQLNSSAGLPGAAGGGKLTAAYAKQARLGEEERAARESARREAKAKRGFRPDFAAYGHGNNHPVNEKQFLRTFNVKIQGKDASQTHTEARRAKKFREHVLRAERTKVNYRRRQQQQSPSRSLSPAAAEHRPPFCAYGAGNVSGGSSHTGTIMQTFNMNAKGSRRAAEGSLPIAESTLVAARGRTVIRDQLRQARLADRSMTEDEYESFLDEGAPTSEYRAQFEREGTARDHTGRTHALPPRPAQGIYRVELTDHDIKPYLDPHSHVVGERVARPKTAPEIKPYRTQFTRVVTSTAQDPPPAKYVPEPYRPESPVTSAIRETYFQHHGYLPVNLVHAVPPAGVATKKRSSVAGSLNYFD